MADVIVVGAGVSGCVAAVELAQAGNRVELIEATSAAGGKLLSYCCKATEECTRCGVCIGHTLVARALRHPGVNLTTGVRVEEVVASTDTIDVTIGRRQPVIDYRSCVTCDACVRACPAGTISRYGRAELAQYRIDYDQCLLTQGDDCTACRDACSTGAISISDPSARTRLRAHKVLVATGHEPFDAARKVRLGYGRVRGVNTGAEMEEMLACRSLPGEPGEHIAFVQCVGSRDPSIGRGYCSAVCCAYALRLARILKDRDSLAQITIYYIDLQNFDKTFTLLREELGQSGVRFVQGVPFDVRESPAGGLTVRFEDPHGEVSEARHDRVVLSVGIGPAAGSRELATLLDLEQDDFGFFRPDGKRVYVTGTCREPQGIAESVTSARAVAHEMITNGSPT